MSGEEPEDSFDEATGDWLWDLEDRYDLGADEPAPVVAATINPRVAGVRKHLRSQNPTRPAGSGRYVGDGTTAMASDAFGGEDVEVYHEPTKGDASVPVLVPVAQRWLNKWAIAAAILGVLGVGGAAWAIGHSGSNHPGQPNVAVSTPVSTGAPQVVTAVASPTSDTTATTVPTTPTATVPTSVATVNAFSTPLTTPTAPRTTPTSAPTTHRTTKPAPPSTSPPSMSPPSTSPPSTSPPSTSPPSTSPPSTSPPSTSPPSTSPPSTSPPSTSPPSTSPPSTSPPSTSPPSTGTTS